MDGWLLKPFQRDTFDTEVRKVLGAPGATRTGVPGANSPSQKLRAPRRETRLAIGSLAREPPAE